MSEATNRYLQGNYAPIGIEQDLADLPVTGDMPSELAGTLYRNGPNPQFSPKEANYHWFTGDGMLHGFTLDNGRVSYRNRWVRTPKWQLEREAGRALFGGFDPRQAEPIAMGKDGGVANTNIVWHAGRLLALEEAHPPTRIDPVSLETLGYLDLGGSPFTAHPKIDPLTGEMLFFGYGATGPLSDGMVYGVLDRDGKLTRFDRFKAPFASMVHDFIATEHYVLFPILPLTGSLPRAMQGGPAYAWEPDKGSWVGILERGQPIETIRWFQGDPSYVFHPMNAWEADGKIFADVMEYPTPPLFPRADGSALPRESSVARLCRWSFDLADATDRYSSLAIDDMAGEFPRFDERQAGLAYRHGYFAGRSSPRSISEFDTIAHFDTRTGRRTDYRLPAGDAASEPIFVPRSETAEEGDGWLLAVIWRAAEGHSDLVVLDAQNVADGPIATAHLPHRVPFGFHGNWRPAV